MASHPKFRIGSVARFARDNTTEDIDEEEEFGEKTAEELFNERREATRLENEKDKENDDEECPEKEQQTVTIHKGNFTSATGDSEEAESEIEEIEQVWGEIEQHVIPNKDDRSTQFVMLGDTLKVLYKD